MNTYGLIGKKLTHSFSKTYFQKKFKGLGIQARYLNYEIDDIQQLRTLVKDDESLIGLNVTIPYKKSVLQIVDKIDAVAAKVGSVNTLKIERKRNKISIIGFNTDVVGFEDTLKPHILGRKNISALVLGTGGAAKAVEYVLNKWQIHFHFVSRNPSDENQINYTDLSERILRKGSLIINTTPIGMYPDVDDVQPIPFQFIEQSHILYDLIYNPEETQFLKKGREKGCHVINGLRMLEIQADASWQLWNS